MKMVINFLCLKIWNLEEGSMCSTKCQLANSELYFDSIEMNVEIMPCLSQVNLPLHSLDLTFSVFIFE